ncbi:MAG: hypothetical protein M1820_009369 [Bogoriella megaspora]|nr:MAG: hypothetical protein M1820_009369 [Bogoriella megaspora]
MIWCLTTYVHDASFVPDAILRVSAKNMSIGGIQRYSTSINGSIPGPELRFSEGKIVWIRVYNDMTDANTTMHWHGLSQAAYPFSDGTPLASQWPIPPLYFFDYEVQLANGTAGTYFYHSHAGFQAVSASGPLIIEDADETPYKTDKEQTVFIQELFNTTDTQIAQGLEATPLIWPGETNGFIVNGETISDWGVVDNSSARLHTIEVDPDTSYRLRFVAATALSYAVFAFQSHGGLQVIEADGHYTKPVPTSLLQMGSAQRFSVLFKTKSCRELEQTGRLDYYLQIENRERNAPVTSYAILRYRNTCGIPSINVQRLPTTSYPTSKPINLPPTINGFLDYQLEPLQPNNFPSAAEVTRRVIVNIQQFISGGAAYVWTDSNISWTEDTNDPQQHVTPSAPYLVSLYENQTAYLPNYRAAVANGGLDPKTKTFPGKMGEVLEIIFQNVGAVSNDNGLSSGALDVHPWHAHGKHYYDLGSGPGPWSAAVMESKLNGTQPLERDTTMLFRYNETISPNEVAGWRAWRLRVEDPGVWMIHCHWLQHMIQGMQTVWVFGDAKDILRVPKPDVEGFLTYGGSVYGNASHAPEMVHFSDVEKV